MSGAPLPVDGPWVIRVLDDLAKFGADPGGGISRPAYSSADLEARAWLEEVMAAVGLEVAVDGARNTIGRTATSSTGVPAIALGSHTDTVPNGGRYDGALGVVAAIAAAKAMLESDTSLLHSVEVLNFAGEEPTLDGGTVGSRAMAGVLPDDFFSSAGYGDMPTAEIIHRAGLSRAGVLSARRARGDLAGYLELHIEQGGVLEAAGTSIGGVQGIVGIRRYLLVSVGQANHAGTTGMARRDDALVRAAPFVSAVRDIAIRHGIVGTVGTVDVSPGAANIIPGEVRMSIEIRGLQNHVLDAAETALRDGAAARGCSIEDVSRKDPVLCDPRLRAAVEEAARQWGYSYRSLASGAGHDATAMANICPVGMLFVPSAGAVSHAPEEYTTPEDCVRGAQTLLGAALALDAVLDDWR